MHWLQSLDTSLFLFANRSLVNPFFDWLMPLLSNNAFFFPMVLLLGVGLLWKGGVRMRLCLVLLAIIIPLGDNFVINTAKHAVGRPRPFAVLPDARVFGQVGAGYVAPATGGQGTEMSAGKPTGTSMPSSHASSWFAATMIFFIYYRRSVWFMLPLALGVSFSRIYNGVHYPGDVLAGAILGAGYAVALLVAFDTLWRWVGNRWFPLWRAQLPTLLNPINPGAPASGRREVVQPDSPAGMPALPRDTHWLRLGYLVIAALFLARVAYLASGSIQLSGDEAYQWLWSKHLALSYYSKPPLIAYTQWLGTRLFGDTELGVRCFAPVIAAVLSWLLLRFFAREISARAGFFLLLIMTATPLMSVGATLLTVDPLSVLFWAAAMLTGWRAIQPEGKTADWLWTGLWLGLGFLSKYTELLQLVCWAVFLALWKPARIHLRRPGPYLALGVNLVCALPVLIWNAQHAWITVSHVANDAGTGQPWRFTFHYLNDFIASEMLLLNPVFFIGALWAAIAFWRNHRGDLRLVYLFSMGAPLFLVYLLLAFHSRVLPNWIAPSVLPLFCLMVIYWQKQTRFLFSLARAGLKAGLLIGLPLVFFLHDTNLAQKIVGKPLPPKPDPITRVRAYDGVARLVGDARRELLAEGKPVFIIAGHYQLAGEVSFYLPEARTNVAANPLVYFLTTDEPINQFYFWPGYQGTHTGQNAIYFTEIGSPPLVQGWVFKWLSGETNLLRYEPQPQPPPPQLLREFESVKDLGLSNVLYRGRIFHTIQLFECRNLK